VLLSVLIDAGYLGRMELEPPPPPPMLFITVGLPQLLLFPGIVNNVSKPVSCPGIPLKRSQRL